MNVIETKGACVCVCVQIALYEWAAYELKLPVLVFCLLLPPEAIWFPIHSFFDPRARAEVKPVTYW